MFGSDMCGVMHEKRTAPPAPSPAVLTAGPSVGIVAGSISSGNREAPSPRVRRCGSGPSDGGYGTRWRHPFSSVGGSTSAPRANKITGGKAGVRDH